MSTTASQRGWGDPGQPGTASATAYQKAHIVTIDVGGVRLHVRREVAPLFAGFIAEIVSHGYNLADRADDWGYICRYIRGYEAQHILSNHAWGLAVDLNASTNPMTSDNVVHTDMPSRVIAAANHWGLSWGGDYTGHRKDPMHFEYLGTPAEAAHLIVSIDPLQSHQEDDLTPEQDRMLREVHEAIKKGAPAMGVPSMQDAVVYANYNLGGVDLDNHPSTIKKILTKLGIG